MLKTSPPLDVPFRVFSAPPRPAPLHPPPFITDFAAQAPSRANTGSACRFVGCTKPLRREKCGADALEAAHFSRHVPLVREEKKRTSTVARDWAFKGKGQRYRTTTPVAPRRFYYSASQTITSKVMRFRAFCHTNPHVSCCFYPRHFCSLLHNVAQHQLPEMLERAGLPSRGPRTSAALEEDDGASDTSLFFSIQIEEPPTSAEATHSTDLQVPAVPTLHSIEVTYILFKAASAGSALRAVYLLLQRLDSDGRAAGPPTPLVVADASQCSARVSLKLFAGDNIRLFLLQRGAGQAVSEVKFCGCLRNSADCFFASSTPPAALLSWTPNAFRPVGPARQPAAARKRSRSPAQAAAPEGGECDDEPPLLVYAPVTGGDDES